jgi:hypothetical protein
MGFFASLRMTFLACVVPNRNTIDAKSPFHSFAEASNPLVLALAS